MSIRLDTFSFLTIVNGKERSVLQLPMSYWALSQKFEINQHAIMKKNTTPKTAKVSAGKTLKPKLIPKTSNSTKKVPQKQTGKTVKPAATKPSSSSASLSKIQPVNNNMIAARAYVLWEKDGRPHGRDVEYWLKAEQQLKQDPQSFCE